MPSVHGDNWLQRESTAPAFLSGSAYDTAWLASLRAPLGATTSRFPKALDWVAASQRPDGSWGGEIRYEHDRIMSTLAALVALGTFNHSSAHDAKIRAGCDYLEQNGHRLAGEPVELVGFELLLPAMIERARNVGIAVPPHLDTYGPQRERKLRLIPPDMLYSPRSTVAHSLEFLGTHADLDGLRRAQGVNGSIGNSPAATAFFLEMGDDPRAEAYLRSCLDPSNGAAVPVLHPCETYELLWAAYHLFLAGVPVALILSGDDRVSLARQLAEGGVSLSPTFPIPDADDTAVALILLDQLGMSVSSSVLTRFATSDGYFASFPFERHASVGVNLHVLHALTRVPGFPDRDHVVDRLVEYIVGEQRSDGYWIDKWHISPYYATAHALRVFAELPADAARKAERSAQRAREWLWQSQLSRGSWGFYGTGTVEETALALIGLTASTADPNGVEGRIGIEALVTLQDAVHELRHQNDAVTPPLWIDKCLYTPRLVVRSIVEAALRSLRTHQSMRLRVA